jgi:hypothetical protein
MVQASSRIEDDFKDINFSSPRLLEDRFRRSIVTLEANADKSIFVSSESRSEAKAIYRMLDNDKFDIDEVKRAHKDVLRRAFFL